MRNNFNMQDRLDRIKISNFRQSDDGNGDKNLSTSKKLKKKLPLNNNDIVGLGIEVPVMVQPTNDRKSTI